jgi:hypothetical protein
MYYLKRKKERQQAAERLARRSPSRMTFASLAAVGAFIVVIKAMNPGANIKPILLMFGGAALGCLVMTVISGKIRKNDD